MKIINKNETFISKIWKLIGIYSIFICFFTCFIWIWNLSLKKHFISEISAIDNEKYIKLKDLENKITDYNYKIMINKSQIKSQIIKIEKEKNNLYAKYEQQIKEIRETPLSLSNMTEIEKINAMEYIKNKINLQQNIYNKKIASLEDDLFQLKLEADKEIFVLKSDQERTNDIYNKKKKEIEKLLIIPEFIYSLIIYSFVISLINFTISEILIQLNKSKNE